METHPVDCLATASRIRLSPVWSESTRWWQMRKYRIAFFFSALSVVDKKSSAVDKKDTSIAYKIIYISSSI